MARIDDSVHQAYLGRDKKFRKRATRKAKKFGIRVAPGEWVGTKHGELEAPVGDLRVNAHENMFNPRLISITVRKGTVFLAVGSKTELGIFLNG